MTYRCALCMKDLPEEAFSYRPDGRARPVRARCKECRRKTANAARYPVACPSCGRHRQLDTNGTCSKCNRAAGLRQCASCGQLLVALLAFWKKQGVCKDCQKAEGPALVGEPLVTPPTHGG